MANASPTSSPPAPTLPSRSEGLPKTKQLGAADPAASNRSIWWSVSVHSLGLFIVLVALLPFVTTDAVWTSDEGALLYQAQHVAQGNGWEVPHPLPEADPPGTQFPIELTVRGVNGGYLPYSRHAALVWTAAIIHSLFGYAGLLVMSIVGTVGAASAAAKLGDLLDPYPSRSNRLGIAALWCTGVGTPMLFNSYIAWAHTLVAALLSWAFVLLIKSQGSPLANTSNHNGADSTAGKNRVAVAPIFVSVGLIFTACLLRTEAVLGGIAIGLALLAVSKTMFYLPRDSAPSKRRWPYLRLSGVAALVAAAAGLITDKLLNPPNTGPLKPASFDEVYGLLDGRLAGFYQTWIRPTTDTGVVSLLFLLGATLILVSGYLARQYRASNQAPPLSPQSSGPAVFAIAGGVLFAGGVALLSYQGHGQVDLPSVLVPGLLVACPGLFAGLALTNKKDFQNPILIAALLTCGLFWLAVLATQYRFGGGAEWGGRYFSATLPLVVPVAVRNCWAIIKQRTSIVPVLLVAALVGTQVLLGSISVSRIRVSRSQVAYISEQVEEAERSMIGDGKPVFVTTVPPAGRWMWSHLDSTRWLWVEPEDLTSTMERLADLGFERIALVSLDQTSDLEATKKTYRPQPQEDLTEPVIVLEAVDTR